MDTNAMPHNQAQILWMQKLTIGLLIVNFALLMSILTWKVLVYPRLMGMIETNQQTLSVLKLVFEHLIGKTETAIQKQNVTLDKVDRIESKLPDPTVWHPGDTERRKGATP